MAAPLRGLLLCGGRATRFGSDKLLAPCGGEPLAARSARSLLAGAGNALAVIPPHAAELRAVLAAAGCGILESERCERGLGASLAAAVGATRDARGWIVALGDMPLVRAETIAAVRAALDAGALVAAPVLAATGERGHPVGFSRALLAELEALDGDEGARVVIARHRGRMVAIPVDDPGILADIDTPADLRAAERAR
jgi:molybdenum cofactor cytidylyltransferase